MAVYKRMSVRMCLLALAVGSLICLGMEVAQVHADNGCDSSEILLSLSACEGLEALPARDSNCCTDLSNVYYNTKPSASCICQTASPTLLAQFKLTAEDIVELITVCISASAVPNCL